MPITSARTPNTVTQFCSMVSGPLRSQVHLIRPAIRLRVVLHLHLPVNVFLPTSEPRAKLTIPQRHLNTLRMFEKSSVHMRRWPSPIKARALESFDRAAESAGLRVITSHTEESLPSTFIGIVSSRTRQVRFRLRAKSARTGVRSRFRLVTWNTRSPPGASLDK